MTDIKPGSQWLLPVRFKAFMGPPKLGPRHGWITLIGGRVLQASGAIIDALIPADRITELEAEVARLRDVLQLWMDLDEEEEGTGPRYDFAVIKTHDILNPTLSEKEAG